MEEKQFDTWNDEKKAIELVDTEKIVCKRRQFWLCKIGENIGSEISKNDPFVRPVLILNERLRGGLVVAVPLTTKFKEHSKWAYYPIIDGAKFGLNAESYCILDQMKIISRKRLIRKLNDMEGPDGEEIPLFDKEQFMKVVKGVHGFI
ncbi:MAG: type II toxin-antitoxin system PemK/MazF family toxin [Candidatus Gracilibacteria bacterium]|nr:type II toxin-antitoxin system PemK/MazF family toxin [Candidatus Gracilibacteria bacterium]